MEVNKLSKYNTLWDYVMKNCCEQLQLSFDDIKSILGFEIDHSFLNFKKELTTLGFSVKKISMKGKYVIFTKNTEDINNETQ